MAPLLRSTVASELRRHGDMYYEAVLAVMPDVPSDVVLHSILGSDVLASTSDLKAAWDIEMGLRSKEDCRWSNVGHVFALSTILGSEITSLFLSC